MTVRILHGDCLAHLDDIEAGSVHAVVTDPPYHLTTGKAGGSGEASVNPNSPAGRSMVTTGFMGQRWDGGDVAFKAETWRKVLRVMRPGAYLVAFGGTRTYHRLACAIEDAGFEIRDQLAWVYGSGFPKGTDKAKIPEGWGGWNTALKPAWEPIVLARKPFKGALAANLQMNGCGAMNIDECRLETAEDDQNRRDNPALDRPAWKDGGPSEGYGYTQAQRGPTLQQGRWPANLMHDGSDDVLAHFPDAPGQIADASSSSSSSSRKTQNVYGDMKRGNGREGEPSADSANDGVVGFNMRPGARRGDEGSAARFFYCAKADREDRNDGLHGMAAKPLNWSSGDQNPGAFQSPNTNRSAQNHHPTVKPTDLMAWLCRLVTPPGGTILDPFMGSGSTGRGALLGDFSFIGIEAEGEYIEIARQRIRAIAPLFVDIP